VWNSFLSKNPAGFYADMARAQVKKLAAAEQSQAVAETARRDAEEQAAKKAEKLQKSVEQQASSQMAAANQQLAAQSKELEEAKKQAELAQQRAEAAREEVEQVKRQAVEEAKQQADKAKDDAKASDAKVAVLTPTQPEQPAAPASTPQIGRTDIARLLQAHLKRVGCNSGKVDGEWDEGSRRALELFNRNAKTKFDTKVASLDALDAVRNETDRVCPLECDRGEHAVGNRCVEIERRREIERHREREAAPRSRSVHRPVVRMEMPSRGFAPEPLQSAPARKSCTLDSSGHRDGGRFCQVF
jgi:DNA polymerase III gamma/tau subunit